MEIVFSVYKTHFEKEHGWTTSLDDILKRIQDKTYNKYIAFIEKLRLLPDAEEEKKLKQQLPLICFSGTFAKRTDKDCIKHSGLICLDFDDESFDTIMKRKEYIHAAFKSPTGTGVKVLVKIPANIKDHSDYYLSLADHFGLASIDEKCKNISRGCYLSYDPDMYYNADSPIYYKLLPKLEVKREKSQVNNPYLVNAEDKIIDRLVKQHQHEFIEGNRNQACYILACELNRFGISDTQAIQVMQQFLEPGFSESEVRRTIKSAYQTNAHEHKTKAFKDSTIVNKTKDLLKRKVDNDTIMSQLKEEDKLSDDQIKAALEQASKDINNEFFWRTTANGGIIIDNNILTEWYGKNNINRYMINTNDWIMIKDDNCHIKEISVPEIKGYIRDYIEDNKEHCSDFAKSQIMRRLNKEYLKDDMLEWLKPIDINWLRDSRNTAYFFYRNTWIRITAKDGVVKIEENHDAGGKIWSDQIIDRDFIIIEDIDSLMQGEFAIFIYNITTGHPIDRELSPEEHTEAIDKFHAMCRTIGYILHNFKDPANPRAVILTDEVISDNPEGGVGKGVFLKGLAKIKNMVTMDGKNFSANKSFLWQRVTLATQILALEDVTRLFDFERQFSMITEGIEVEKKNKDSFYIPYDKSPKLIITSNYVIQGSGASHDRRRIEIELKQYFKPDYSPRDQFGHNLYDDWTSEEWNLFDNFMMYCVHQYLVHGIAKPKNKNLSYKKLKNAVPDMFIEWMQDKNFLHGEYYQLKEICDQYRAIDYDNQKATNRKISKWIKEYCDYRKWECLTRTIGTGTQFVINPGEK